MERIELTADGLIPAGTDIDTVLASPFERDLIAVRYTYRRGCSNAMAAEVYAVPTALQALTADQRLVELLTGRRWSTMQDAREAGASWTDIGAALGMSKQAAVDWYRRKIAGQEKYASAFHDTERARAALNEGE